MDADAFRFVARLDDPLVVASAQGCLGVARQNGGDFGVNHIGVIRGPLVLGDGDGGDVFELVRLLVAVQAVAVRFEFDDFRFILRLFDFVLV